ncbi:MAG: hypothetical protein H6673_01990 [Anaerolineales bacterium]|nr:hypothetical protein [Anaerolineales bacterium]
MTISFFEPGDVPQPPDKVKITHLTATPVADGWRVKIDVHVTPFQLRPNLEIALVREGDNPVPVSTLSIVETMHPRMEFTMHVRGVTEPWGHYRLHAMVYYRDPIEEDAIEPPPMQVKDTQEIKVSIQPEAE